MARRKITLLTFLGVAVLLVAGTFGYRTLVADVVGVDAGTCENVDINPLTGERSLYCCMDELYVYRQEAGREEIIAFVEKLEEAAALSVHDAASFFLQPYESRLHTKYGWDSVCGPLVACEECSFGSRCGNNVIQNKEECDDGNTLDGDGCSAECLVEKTEAEEEAEEIEEIEEDEEKVENEPGDQKKIPSSDSSVSSESFQSVLKPFALPKTPEPDVVAVAESEQPPPPEELPPEPPPAPVNFCGDGVPAGLEECDDGNTANGDGCSQFCTKEITPTIAAACGNALVEEGEECDAGILNGTEPDTCRSDCTLARCGDGIIDSNEECDDGNTADGDGCTWECMTEKEAEDPEDRFVREPSEQPEQASAEPSEPSELSHSSGVCGNGITDQGEVCDLGRYNADIHGSSCRTDCSTGRCGDGIIDARETCDDGNRTSGDGCSSICKSELRLVSTILSHFESLPPQPTVAVAPLKPAAPTYPVLPVPQPQQQNAPVQQYPVLPTSQPLPVAPAPLTASAIQETRREGPKGNTGPMAVVIMAVGAAGGVAFTRRKRR